MNYLEDWKAKAHCCAECGWYYRPEEPHTIDECAEAIVNDSLL